MAKTTTSLAIDLDPEGLLVVSGPAGRGAVRVEHAHAWLPGNEHGPPALTAENAKKLGADLRARLDAAGIPPGPVLVGIGRDKVILKEVKYPGVDPAEETRLVYGQAARELGDLRGDTVLDYAPLPDSGEGVERRALVVVLKAEFLDAVKAFVEAGRWKLAAVTPRPYAIAAGLAEAIANRKSPPLAQPDAAAAVVSLSPQGGEFTVIRNWIVTFTRAIPQQSLENEGTLLNEIRRNLTTYESQNQNRPVSAVYVPEAEHTLGGWAGKLEHSLPVPVHTYDPVATAAESVPLKLRGRYAGAAGLLAGRSVGLPVNLAAPRTAKVKADPNKPILIGAAIAAAVLIVGGGLFGYMALSAADDRVALKKQQKEGLEKLLADADPDGKRIAAAEQWEARGVNYLDEMFDLADRMPPGDTVRLNKITGTAIRVDKNGKQNGQSFFVLTVGAKNPTASGDLVTAIDRENTKDRKFYVGTMKNGNGADSHANTHNQLATIMTTVNHRSPGEYTRYPMFSPPRRGVIPAAVAPDPTSADDKKTVNPDDLP